jgi:hypothetical protein
MLESTLFCLVGVVLLLCMTSACPWCTKGFQPSCELGKHKSSYLNTSCVNVFGPRSGEGPQQHEEEQQEQQPVPATRPPRGQQEKNEEQQFHWSECTDIYRRPWFDCVAVRRATCGRLGNRTIEYAQLRPAIQLQALQR